jgi:hypothetical protein
MRFLIVISLIFASFTSQAAIIFAPGLAYTKDTTTVDGTKTESKRTSLDLRLLYLHQSGLLLGGMYAMTSINDDDQTAVGPSLGYNAKNGFFALFTYFLVSEYKFSSGGKYKDGMGPQIDIGWVFPLTESIYLGPQLSYRSVSYSKIDSGGNSVSTDTTVANTTPYITLWLKF